MKKKTVHTGYRFAALAIAGLLAGSLLTGCGSRKNEIRDTPPEPAAPTQEANPPRFPRPRAPELMLMTSPEREGQSLRAQIRHQPGTQALRRRYRTIWPELKTSIFPRRAKIS